MTLWYDITDIINWHYSHLTGIQRSLTGILDGISEAGIVLHLTYFNEQRGGFCLLPVNELPTTIRRHLKPATLAQLSETEGRCLEASRHDSPLSPLSPPHTLTPFASGDTLFSLGATWLSSNHNNEVLRIKQRGIRLVTMLYDLIPTLRPQWMNSHINTTVFTEWARRWFRHSNMILTISQFSRSEIEAYAREAGIQLPPLAVIRLADLMEDPSTAPPPLPRFVPTRPFFLCVSTIDVRKNHRLLYKAWEMLAQSHGSRCPDLLCIGTASLFGRSLIREINMNRAVNAHIRFLSDIRDPELRWYYRNAQATIYPSEYEGWGLPVGESLAHGKLCLASNATSIPEIGGELPLYFDPFTPRELVAHVEHVLEAPEWVAKREEKIRNEYRKTSWKDTATSILTTTQSVTAGPGNIEASEPSAACGTG